MIGDQHELGIRCEHKSAGIISDRDLLKDVQRYGVDEGNGVAVGVDRSNDGPIR